MKFLHLSDLHLGKLLFEYNLLEDQEFWCRQLLELLRRDPHDAVIIAGDLYDRSVPPGEAVALMDRFLTALVAELKLPVLAIAGNHDSPQRLAFGAGLYRSSGLYLAAVPQREIQRVTLADQWGEVDFWLLPYLTPADGKTLFTIAEGRLVNLAAGDGHPAEIMDMSFAVQALSAEYLAEHRGRLLPGVIPVPRELDEAVARRKLKAMGVEIDVLSREQQEHLGI